MMPLPAIGALSAAILLAATAHASEWTGAPRIVDGDTIALAGQRLRLIGLDAPEGTQTCQTDAGRQYDCGREATTALTKIIAGRSVRCEGDKTDRYYRPLVICRIGALDINAEMVRSGWAVAFATEQYEAQEREAKAARRGMWAGTFERPTNWRKAQRTR